MWPLKSSLIPEMSLNFTVYRMGIIAGGCKCLKNRVRKSLWIFFLAHWLKSSYRYSNTAWSREDRSKYEEQRFLSLPGKALLPSPGSTLISAQVWSLDYSALWCTPLFYAAITKQVTNLHVFGSELSQTHRLRKVPFYSWHTCTCTYIGMNVHKKALTTVFPRWGVRKMAKERGGR